MQKKIFPTSKPFYVHENNIDYLVKKLKQTADDFFLIEQNFSKNKKNMIKLALSTIHPVFDEKEFKNYLQKFNQFIQENSKVIQFTINEEPQIEQTEKNINAVAFSM